MQIAQARPPFVEFKRIAIHDPIKSNEVGRRVTKDVDYAFIMQPGSRDQVERKAADWLASIKRKALDAATDAYPQEWVDGFHAKYKAWLDGHDAPLDGTSVKEWPVLSPSQAENFIALRVLTIEDVAAMTEEAMGLFGMGGRDLREKARDWLQGSVVAGDLQAENDALKKQLAALAQRLDAIESQDTEDKPRRGRKPKLETA